MRPRLVWGTIARNIAQTTEYRGAFFVLMVATMVAPVTSLLVWLTVSKQGMPLPYGRSQFVTYYLLLVVVAMLTSTWGSLFLAADIREGRLSPRLLRPVPPILDAIGNNVGEKVVKLPLLVPPIALIAVSVGDLRLPADARRWLAFSVAILLAGLLAFLIDHCMGLAAFWVDDITGIERLRFYAGLLLSGQVVPLALLPKRMHTALIVQPLRSTLSFPLEIMTADPSLTQGFALQAGWALCAYAGYRVLWRRGLRRYGAVGA